MARLNVYVPDDLTPLIDRWRDQVNLSEVCACALRDSLEAMETGRSARQLLGRLFSGPSNLEREVASRFDLPRVIVRPPITAGEDVRDTIGRATAAASRVKGIIEDIRSQVGERDQVFFLVSGGVDSMVAFTLCAQAPGANRVRGLYVDTGFMRLGEEEQLQANLREMKLADRVTVYDAWSSTPR